MRRGSLASLSLLQQTVQLLCPPSDSHASPASAVLAASRPLASSTTTGHIAWDARLQDTPLVRTQAPAQALAVRAACSVVAALLDSPRPPAVDGPWPLPTMPPALSDPFPSPQALVNALTALILQASPAPAAGPELPAPRVGTGEAGPPTHGRPSLPPGPGPPSGPISMANALRALHAPPAAGWLGSHHSVDILFRFVEAFVMDPQPPAFEPLTIVAGHLGSLTRDARDPLSAAAPANADDDLRSLCAVSAHLGLSFVNHSLALSARPWPPPDLPACLLPLRYPSARGLYREFARCVGLAPASSTHSALPCGSLPA